MRPAQELVDAIWLDLGALMSEKKYIKMLFEVKTVEELLAQNDLDRLFFQLQNKFCFVKIGHLLLAEIM